MGKKEGREAEKPVKIGLVCCSNGLSESFKPAFQEFLSVLKSAGLEPVYGSCLFAGRKGAAAGTARERAGELTALYCDPAVRAVFDLSGGDYANEILPWIDYGAIEKAPEDKLLFGYSDLTCVLNAVYARTGRRCGLYQLRNILRPEGRGQLKDLVSLLRPENTGSPREAFKETVLTRESRSLCGLSCRFVQGSAMEGTAVGGNIRCFLKLSGTPYFPDLEGKILILEANSGRADRITACLAQLSQMRAFEKIRGILLGTFSELEREEGPQAAERLVLSFAGNLPVAVTREIGHGADARCALIGGLLRTV